MSKSAQAIQVNRSSSSTRCWLGMRIGKRTAFWALAVGLLGAGLALNWNWLVAAGIAPLLVALAPCAVMCGDVRPRVVHAQRPRRVLQQEGEPGTR